MSGANPINITQIDHVVLRVENLEVMLAFYRDVLGCRLERGPSDIGLAQLRAGRSLIDLVDVNGELGRQGGGAPDQSAPNVDHLCLLIDPWDAGAIQRHLADHSVEADDIEQRYGATGFGPSIYIRDPEGNRVELKGGSPAG